MRLCARGVSEHPWLPFYSRRLTCLWLQYLQCPCLHVFPAPCYTWHGVALPVLSWLPRRVPRQRELDTTMTAGVACSFIALLLGALAAVRAAGRQPGWHANKNGRTAVLFCGDGRAGPPHQSTPQGWVGAAGPVSQLSCQYLWRHGSAVLVSFPHWGLLLRGHQHEDGAVQPGHRSDLEPVRSLQGSGCGIQPHCTTSIISDEAQRREEADAVYVAVGEAVRSSVAGWGGSS